MDNTTFTGPVRSQNGFQNIVGDRDAPTNTMTLSVYTATVTVANGATTG